MKGLIFSAMLLATGFAQQCEVQDPLRVDCGYMGIDQSACVAKGCCWKPAFDFQEKENDTPWCYYPAG